MPEPLSPSLLHVLFPVRELVNRLVDMLVESE